MLSWIAPRVPTRRCRIDLHTLILDNGRAKVTLNQSEGRLLRMKSSPQPKSQEVERLQTIHSLLVYNSLPPAPADDPLKPNSSLCPPFHIHLHEDETFRILSGEARFFLVSQHEEVPHTSQDVTAHSHASLEQNYDEIGIFSRVVSRGSSITIPCGQIHTFRNASTTTRLELEFGFSPRRSSTQVKDIQSWKPVRALDMHLARRNFGAKVPVDHLEPLTMTGVSAEAATNAKAKLVGLHDSDTDSDPISPRRSTTKERSDSRPEHYDVSVSHAEATNTVDDRRLNSFRSGTNPPDKLDVTREFETDAFSPQLISTKMRRFFLNTQLYRSDCAAQSIPRALPQLLLFNHAAGVVLVPPWLLRSRMLRPFASTIGRVMNVLIGVVYGGWICGLKHTYREYTEPASLDSMMGQAAKSITDLASEVRDLEAQMIRERDSQARLKEVEDSGLVCSAWKSHEFDGQDEGWRKDV